MTAALATGAPTPSEAEAGRILEQLIQGSEEARMLAEAGSGTSLQALLNARGEMLAELDRTVRALGAEPQRSAVGKPPLSVHRQRLLEMGIQLERANTRLLATAKSECVNIAASIRDLNRPDGIASAYSATGSGHAPRRLDLVR